MKHKKKLARLSGRIKYFEENSFIKQANMKNPGTYKKPGSLNK